MRLLIVLNLGGCAVATHVPKPVSTVATASHIALGGRYVDSASKSTSAAKAGVVAIQVAAKAALSHAETLVSASADENARHDAATAVVADTQRIEEEAVEVKARLDDAAEQLAQEKTERAQAQTSLAEVQTSADVLAQQEQAAQTAKSAAEKKALELKSERDKLAARLDKLVLMLAIAAGLLTWSAASQVVSKIDSVALPWSILGPIGIGVLTFFGVGAWLRFNL